LVEKIAKIAQLRLTPEGYSICLLFLQTVRTYLWPLTSAIIRPYRPELSLIPPNALNLTACINAWSMIFDQLLCAVGLKAALTLGALREQNPR